MLEQAKVPTSSFKQLPIAAASRKPHEPKMDTYTLPTVLLQLILRYTAPALGGSIPNYQS